MIAQCPPTTPTTDSRKVTKEDLWSKNIVQNLFGGELTSIIGNTMPPMFKKKHEVQMRYIVEVDGRSNAHVVMTSYFCSYQILMQQKEMCQKLGCTPSEDTCSKLLLSHWTINTIFYAPTVYRTSIMEEWIVNHLDSEETRFAYCGIHILREETTFITGLWLNRILIKLRPCP